MAIEIENTGSEPSVVSEVQPCEELEQVTLLCEERNTALEAVYDGLSDDVVAMCERARGRIRRPSLVELRKVRDALAPSGRFKEWCLAVGINYGTAKNTLSHAVGNTTNRSDSENNAEELAAEVAAGLAESASNSKRTDNTPLSSRLLSVTCATREQRSDLIAKLRDVLRERGVDRDDYGQAVLFLYQYWWEHEHRGTKQDVGGHAA